MSVARQMFDAFVAVVVFFVGTIAVALFAPRVALITGTILACMFYFSRYPWGSRQGERYNRRIDAVYDEYLPF